ncbi:MAG TPA: hypothetical protein VK543_19375 [Puia sp.]|nr:hypothetical protein [Puia sp.]
MKKVVIILCVALASNQVNAQSDIKAMLKQITLLGIYIRDLEKAIVIAREGLKTIDEIKHGEFNLHNMFFSSLRSVNPAVVKYSKVAEIIVDQLAIVSDFKNLLDRLNSSGKITKAELSYVTAVYSHISDECSKSINDLIEVTSDGKLEMTDGERIKRIDGIYSAVKDKYAFTKSFTSNADRVARERIREPIENQLLKSLY